MYGLEAALEEERVQKRETAGKVLSLEKELRSERELYHGNSKEHIEVESELRDASRERERAEAALGELKRSLQVSLLPSPNLFILFLHLLCNRMSFARYRSPLSSSFPYLIFLILCSTNTTSRQKETRLGILNNPNLKSRNASKQSKLFAQPQRSLSLGCAQKLMHSYNPVRTPRQIVRSLCRRRLQRVQLSLGLCKQRRCVNAS